MSDFTASTCLGANKFVYILDEDDQVDFEEAKDRCETLGGQLASVRNEEIHQALFELSRERRGDAWIGVDALGAIGGGSGDPANFTFSDGTLDGVEFFQDREVGEFPWNNEEPNNFDGNQDCVVIREQEFLWNDFFCDEPFEAVFCEVINDPDCDEENNLALVFGVGAVSGLCAIGIVFLLVSFQRRRKVNSLVKSLESKPKKKRRQAELSGLAAPSPVQDKLFELGSKRDIRNSNLPMGSEAFSVDSKDIGDGRNFSSTDRY